MTISDLYMHTDNDQEFIIWLKSELDKPYYRGKLENYPREFMYMLVDNFRAIDFNTIEVKLIG